MEYLLQISYVISSDTAKPAAMLEDCDALANEIEAMLPEEFSRDALTAKKENVSIIRLKEGENCLRCSACGSYMAMDGAGALPGIPEGVMVDGRRLCKHCAWERGIG